MFSLRCTASRTLGNSAVQHSRGVTQTWPALRRKRFVVRADDKLTAFLELARIISTHLLTKDVEHLLPLGGAITLIEIARPNAALI